MTDPTQHGDERGPGNRADAPSSRRDFLKYTAAGILSTALVGGEGYALAPSPTPPAVGGDAAPHFRSAWPAEGSRVWPGPEYWTNPLQDWRIHDGRLEMVAGGANRNVQLLTRQMAERPGGLQASVLLGLPAGSGGRRAGFAVGVRGPLGDYRNNAIHGKGLLAGLSADGQLFMEGAESTGSGAAMGSDQGMELRLAVEPGRAGHTVVLSAHEPGSGRELGRLRREGVPEAQLVGNVALFADGEDSEERGAVRAWFRDWRLSGDKLDAHEEHAFGPVLFAQHTLSRGVMKMTAQMPPVGSADSQVVRLQLQRGDGWTTAAEAPIDALSRTATFRVPDWDASRDVPYRLAYTLDGREHHFAGTVRRDPVDKRQLVVAGLSCMVDHGFPNTDVVRGVAYHDPDVLLFMGDQLYEASGGFGVQRNSNVPLAALDYLRKWYMAGWSFGDLLRDRPSAFLTDDHDVYHGNIWGEGGARAPSFEEHPEGGYVMPAEWVNMVQRTQTSHHPDPFDPTPVKQGIGVYYGEMLYGRASFALLEDRKWKTGPEGVVPPGPGRPDHIKDPTFDTRLLDVPEAELLGERQLRFLDEWGADWRGADFKVAVSQTIFAQIPNLHGEAREWLAADLDSNGWPQTPRDEALRRIRKAGAFHLCGDQHIPMLVRYGIEEWDDAGYTFCVPAIATGYPRAFHPRQPGRNRAPGAPEHTGQFLDGFGNKVTVHAVANPAAEPRRPPRERLADKVSGYGIVRLDREARTITMECWPMLSDPARGDGEQFPGWPMTIPTAANLGEAARAELPPLHIEGLSDPIVQVIDDATGEVVCTHRPGGTRCTPRVFREGTYSVRIGDDRGWRETVRGLVAVRGARQPAVRIAAASAGSRHSSS